VWIRSSHQVKDWKWLPIAEATGKQKRLGAGQRGREPPSRTSRRILVVQAKERAATHRRGSRNKAAFGVWQFDHFQLDTVLH
jgi:hypothetical protein